MLAHIISLFAPHKCLECGTEGSVLCAACDSKLPSVPVSGPILPGVQFFAATSYRGAARRMVHALKFERSRAAAADMARIIHKRLPAGYKPDVVTWVPTATGRVRTRGYDQARVIALLLARRMGVPCVPLLARSGQERQVGKDKAARAAQASGMFRTRSPMPSGRRVLLIDDVLTTGATLRAGCGVLLQAGAWAIDAAVFAKADR